MKTLGIMPTWQKTSGTGPRLHSMKRMRPRDRAVSYTHLIEKGIEKGAASLIETCKELGLSRAETAEKLVDKLTLSEDTAEAYLIEFWE